MDRGVVVWFTGLPGSGKTTIARELEKRLRSIGKRVEVLDGDEVRRWLSPEAGFSREDRERHIKRVAHVSQLLARNGVIVLVSLVSPYKNVREYAKTLNSGSFIEVYTKCSVEECIRRDPKGLYKKALKGEIKDMTGIQDIYEAPQNPDITLDTERTTVDECVEYVLNHLRERGFL